MKSTNFQIIVRFGGRLTDIGRECTHIVSPRVTRTVKFLSGISVCRHIITPEWVEECGRAGRLVDEGGYVLRDRDAEEMFDMNIAVSLTRAKKKQLLTVSLILTFSPTIYLLTTFRETTCACFHLFLTPS